MPRFSIILVHYQGATPHQELLRAVNSVQAQTCKDFELLAYHDGPLINPSLKMPVPFTCTDRNHQDCGHSLRDLGIRQATGDYVLHLNSDNILYPNALGEITKAIDRPPRIFDDQTGGVLDPNNIIIFSIIFRGLQRLNDRFFQYKENPEFTLTLTGNPPLKYHIDALQLVMRRDLWLAEGGWYDKTFAADGAMYERFAKKYGYRCIDQVLGEHW
jgi:hypothetical protein